MDAIVRNAEDRSRYELVVDGEVIAVADYRVQGDVVVLPHTEVVPPPPRPGATARQLVQGALDDLRAQGQARSSRLLVRAVSSSTPTRATPTSSPEAARYGRPP